MVGAGPRIDPVPREQASALDTTQIFRPPSIVAYLTQYQHDMEKSASISLPGSLHYAVSGIASIFRAGARPVKCESWPTRITFASLRHAIQLFQASLAPPLSPIISPHGQFPSSKIGDSAVSDAGPFDSPALAAAPGVHAFGNATHHVRRGTCTRVKDSATRVSSPRGLSRPRRAPSALDKLPHCI
jgi:hypothetical protein